MSLPFVLAGPILRRVEPRRVSVWIALSAPATVTLKIWTGSQTAGAANTATSGDAPLATGTLETLPFGRALHVIVVTAKAEAAPLRAGQIYSYGLGFSGEDNPKDLKDAGLLADEKADNRLPGVDESAPLGLALGYGLDRLPSFVLPAEAIAGLKLAHGSCRKPHAYGPDALAWLDDRIEKEIGNVAERPQQLFLTGDQIYADDVSASLLHMLHRLGIDLQNGTDDQPKVHEKLTLTHAGEAGTAADIDLDSFPIARRAKMLRNDAQFTTSDAENHLLGFYEFAAMYLAVWSPRVWRELPSVTCEECGWAPDARPWPEENCGRHDGPRPGSTADCKLAVASMYGPITGDAADPRLLTKPELCDDHPSLTAWQRHDAPRLAQHRKHVLGFRATVPKVARALANVPTYMIFDDHEVTDDWNISRDWVTNVNGSPLGRAILRNGLLAYGIFQGWGNDTETFNAVQSFSVMGDGERREWAMGFPLAKVLSIEVNSVAKTVDLKMNADDHTADFYWQAGDPVIHQDTNGTVLTGSDTLDIDYRADSGNAAFLTEAAKVLATNEDVPAADTAALEQCLGLGIAPDASKQIKWNYQLPGVKHLTVVLDTRTRRGFPDTLPTPPSLLGESLKKQLPGGPTAQERELLILVSPVPVLGPGVIEQIAQPLADAVHDVKLTETKLHYSDCNPMGHLEGRFFNDVESWAANELAFEEFIARVATHQRVVILSGDVHYGTSLSLDYWKSGKDQAASRIVQLTASALHNPAAKGFLPIVRTHGLLQGALQAPSRVRLGWTGLSTIVVPEGVTPGLGRLVRLKQRPSIVPADGWPAGTSFPDDGKPDWAWRITPARDPRPRESLPPAVRPAELVGGELIIGSGGGTEPAPDLVFAGYARVAARHAATALVHIEHVRMIIFESNLGLVTFTGAADELVVTHLLLSFEDRHSSHPAPNTVHVLPLAREATHPELTHG